MNLEKRYEVVPSEEKNEEGSHIVLAMITSEHGCNCGRVFKGSREQCEQKAREYRESEKERKKDERAVNKEKIARRKHNFGVQKNGIRKFTSKSKTRTNN